MQIEPHHSQEAPAEWTGARLIVEKWLRGVCARESVTQIASGAVVMLVGLVTLGLTSCFAAMFFVLILVRVNRPFEPLSSNASHAEPILFAILFLIFLSVSISYACHTRWKAEDASKIQFGSFGLSAGTLALELLSAGPIFMVLAVQDFQKYLRLSRVDILPVSALVLWLFDKGGRAGFAEISLAFPGLNVVRVLPQLRDLPGIHWWPDEGSISLRGRLRDTLAELLHRQPKTSFASAGPPPKPPHFNQPAPNVSAEMLSWYNLLNLPPFATLRQVKIRYRNLAKIHHPDARARGRPAGEVPDDEQMKRINEAYHNILKHSQEQAGSFNS